MTQKQPRRPRRRLPAPSLPKPGQASPAYSSAESGTTQHHREHHITTDYRYVTRDLVLIAGVTAVCLAFIVGMSFVL